MARHVHGRRDAGKAFRFGFIPQSFRDRTASTREDQQRRPAIEKQLRAAFGDPFVVTAQHQDRVSRRELVFHLMVIPELFGECADVRFHSCSKSARPEIFRRQSGSGAKRFPWSLRALPASERSLAASGASSSRSTARNSSRVSRCSLPPCQAANGCG